MKAYMSSIHHTRYPLPGTCALSELRRILAETEPAVSNGGAWHSWPLTGQGTEMLALADSLRAFIGECDCHAEECGEPHTFWCAQVRH
jgi:hypothetical protein